MSKALGRTQTVWAIRQTRTSDRVCESYVWLGALEDAGQSFSEYQDRSLVNLPCKRIQVDEVWAFCYAKQKNVPTTKAAPDGAGDIWTWVGWDADTKLVASFYVGARDSEAAANFIYDLAPRLASRVQLTSDGHKPYL